MNQFSLLSLASHNTHFLISTLLCRKGMWLTPSVSQRLQELIEGDIQSNTCFLFQACARPAPAWLGPRCRVWSGEGLGGGSGHSSALLPPDHLPLWPAAAVRGWRSALLLEDQVRGGTLRVGPGRCLSGALARAPVCCHYPQAKAPKRTACPEQTELAPAPPRPAVQGP